MYIDRRIISVILLNEANSLSRIVGLFSARGYNIESLTVAPIDNSKYSRLTVVTSGDLRIIEQIIKQLYKIVPVYKVIDSSDLITKEMLIVKFAINEEISKIETLAKSFNGRLADVNENSALFVISEDHEKVNAFLNAVKKFNPKEIARSGAVTMEKGYKEVDVQEIVMVEFYSDEDIDKISSLAKKFKGKIIHTDGELSVVVKNRHSKIESFLKSIKKFNPKEITRSTQDKAIL